MGHGGPEPRPPKLHEKIPHAAASTHTHTMHLASPSSNNITLEVGSTSFNTCVYEENSQLFAQTPGVGLSDLSSPLSFMFSLQTDVAPQGTTAAIFVELTDFLK